MKKIAFTLLFIAFTFNSFAQKGERRERIKALKVALITEKLELTKAEAEKFWPIYNAHEKEMDMLRINGREKRRNMNLETITEAEAKKALKDFLAFEQEKHKKEADLVESLLTAIPAKKIILLKSVEDQFKRKILDELRKRRGRNGDRD